MWIETSNGELYNAEQFTRIEIEQSYRDDDKNAPFWIRGTIFILNDDVEDRFLSLSKKMPEREAEAKMSLIVKGMKDLQLVVSLKD